MAAQGNVRGGYCARKRSASPVDPKERQAKRDRQAKELNDDWRAGTLVQQQNHLLETGLCSDCSFKVGPEDGETQVFQAHKLMLARASPVFYAMFFGPMPETKEEIRIVDMKPETFKHMLKFIYTEMQFCDPDLFHYETYNELEALILAADKYLITALKVAAIKDMNTHIFFNRSYTWRCMELADAINDSQLRKVCSKGFASDAPQNIETEQFLTLSHANLAAICKQDSLQLLSELPLVNACVNWAKNKCAQRNLDTSGANIREFLGPEIIASLRFLSLSPEEFVDGPGAQDWLTKDEIFSILKGIVSRKTEEVEGFCGIRKPRCEFEIMVCARKGEIRKRRK